MDVNLKTLVCSAQCDYQYGGSASQSSFISAPLSSSHRRTAELHNDGVLYLFEEPVKSMAKHLREQIYMQGCRVLDVGSVHHKECLALFLNDYDYAERVDDFGNVKGQLFTKFVPKIGKQSSGSPTSAKRALDATKGYYMVLLYMADKKTKWRMLRHLQQASLEYSHQYPLSTDQQRAPSLPAGGPFSGGDGAVPLSGSMSSLGSANVHSDSGVPPMVRNKFNEKLNAGGTGAGLLLQDATASERGRRRGQYGATTQRSGSESSTATVLSDHEVLKLEDVLKTYEEKVQAEEPRAGSFAASGSTERLRHPSGRDGNGRIDPKEEEEEEELLPEVSSPLDMGDAGDARQAASPLRSQPTDVCCANGSPVLEDAASFASASGAHAGTRGCPARLLRSPLYHPCIEGRPDNQRCADCDDPFPTWCVLRPFGCFVCINCVGVHRQLWSNKCREAEMDKWPAEDVAFMASRGNAAVNDELEFRVAYPAGSVAAALGQAVAKPTGKQTPAAQRAAYIQYKYEERLFTREKHPEVCDTDDAVGSPRRGASVVAEALATTNGNDKTAASVDAARAVADGIISELATDGGEEDGPPQYGGLADLLVKELVTSSESYPGAVCTITNGFQALRTKGGRKLVNMPTSTAWDEHLQVGVESAAKLLYCAVYSAKSELLAAAEFYLPSAVVNGGEAAMVAVDMPWCELNKKASARHPNEVWQVTMLTSFRPLA